VRHLNETPLTNNIQVSERLHHLPYVDFPAPLLHTFAVVVRRVVLLSDALTVRLTLSVLPVLPVSLRRSTSTRRRCCAPCSTTWGTSPTRCG
jgi:hypothetical protein